MGNIILPVYKEMDITFGEMCQALGQLHFTEADLGEAVQFTHKSGAKVTHKKRSLEMPIWKAIVASVSQDLEFFGVIKHPHDLAKLVEKNRLAAKSEALAA